MTGIDGEGVGTGLGEVEGGGDLVVRAGDARVGCGELLVLAGGATVSDDWGFESLWVAADLPASCSLLPCPMLRRFINFRY
jgi:hypothetical protein